MRPSAERGPSPRPAERSRRLSFRSGAPYLVPAAVALLVGLGLWAGRHRLASLGAVVESPDTQIRRALASQVRAHLDEVYGFRAGGTVELSAVRYRDVTTSVEGERATVVAVLDAEGRVVWRGGAASLSYLGRERFHMRPCSIALWCAEGDQFERLRGVLLLLFRRADAFEARDPGAYAPLLSERYQDRGLDRAGILRRLRGDLRAGLPASERLLGWQIRVDRETAEVGEDFELSLAGREPKPLRARYRLLFEESRWRIAGGL